MRAALLAPLLALAAPLAAQDSEPAPAAPPPDPAPGPIVLVSGPDVLTTRLGDAPINPAMTLCLDPGEEAVFASDRTTFTLSGGSTSAACFTPEYGERKAFMAEQREAAAQAVEQAQADYDAAATADDKARTLAALDAARQQLWAIDPPPAVGAGVQVVESTRGIIPPRRRTRTGATRPAAAPPPPPPPPPRPVIFRIASGSPAVLARVPRGTLVQRSTALCLKAGEQISVAASNGQSVTYTGPGCLNRTARPTRENVGGFTFG